MSSTNQESFVQYVLSLLKQKFLFQEYLTLVWSVQVKVHRKTVTIIRHNQSRGHPFRKINQPVIDCFRVENANLNVNTMFLKIIQVLEINIVCAKSKTFAWRAVFTIKNIYIFPF